MSNLNNNILMCSPDFFGVSYVINPWMEGNEHKVDLSEAKKQWNNLYSELSKVSNISLLSPKESLPDLVFTANAGLVYKNIFIPSNFQFKERQGEQTIFIDFFSSLGFQIKLIDKKISFEGAGDALFDKKLEVLWSGYGFRSNKESANEIEKIIQKKVVSLKLIDQRFYHLDTCFCPLENGYLMYFPNSFDKESNEIIKEHISQDLLIEVSEEDALNFSCNAVNIGEKIFLNDCSSQLQKKLNKSGFQITKVKLSEFLKSGGASKCLTIAI